MTIDDLLKMWANWLRLPCNERLILSGGKHPLARLMDGNMGGRPIYFSTLPYNINVDDSMACKVEIAISKLNKRYRAVVQAEYLQRAKQEQKAEDMGITANAYRLRLHRAKQNLSLLLKDLLKLC